MNVLATPRPKVPDRNREEWKNWKDPVLTATQAKSWKALAKEGASYAIDITLSNIYLEMSRVDKQGRWEYDPQRRKVFALDTPIREVVQVILEDWTRQKTMSEKKDMQ
jgi:hypothetical protein